MFWGADGHVMDWRWLDEHKVPWQNASGRWQLLWWETSGIRPQHVIGESLIFTRTSYDVEMKERERWPDWKRRKLR